MSCLKKKLEDLIFVFPKRSEETAQKKKSDFSFLPCFFTYIKAVTLCSSIQQRLC